MKANINQPSKTYSKIPSSWEARPNTMNYHNLPAEEHLKDGWRDVVRPQIDSSIQYLGSLYYYEQEDVFTYQVLVKSPEQLEAERRAQVPSTITPTQGRIQLKRLGLLAQVNTMVENATDEALQIYWEYALSWDRYNSYIIDLANLLGMSEEDLDNFFIQASQID